MPGGDVVRLDTDIPHFEVRKRLLEKRLGLEQVVGQLKGIVDEDIEPALFGSDLIEQRCYLLVTAMVAGHRNALAAGIPAALGAFGRGLSDRTRQVVGTRGN